MPAKAPPKSLHATPADTTEAVAAFMAALDHPHKAAVEAVRKAILGADKSIREGVKWNAPSFRTTEYFATVNLRAKEGIQVVMHLGAKVRALPAGGVKIEDPEGMLKWLAKDRAIVTFADGADVTRRKGAFQRIVQAWIENGDR
ncbi:MAG: DUF1801 domain-containing protein [Betaproteobacteria bacterium]|nr:DUF1801 domain-containing protein [Betaproteobacteria bacterium]